MNTALLTKIISGLSTGCLAALTVESILRGDILWTLILASCTMLLLLVTLVIEID